MFFFTRWLQIDKRMLVYDRWASKVTIENPKKFTIDCQVLMVNIPRMPSMKGLDRWEIYVDGKAESIAARQPGQEILPDHYFLGLLNLPRMGVKGRFLRRLGKLERLVVLVPKINHYSTNDEQREDSVKLNKTKECKDNKIGETALTSWSTTTLV